MYQTFSGKKGDVTVEVVSGRVTITAKDKNGKVLDELRDTGQPTRMAVANVIEKTDVCPVKVSVLVEDTIRKQAYRC
jgi:hypothetical protein